MGSACPQEGHASLRTMIRSASRHAAVEATNIPATTQKNPSRDPALKNRYPKLTTAVPKVRRLTAKYRLRSSGSGLISGIDSYYARQEGAIPVVGLGLKIPACRHPPRNADPGKRNSTSSTN